MSGPAPGPGAAGPPLAELGALADPAWLVGGAVRDELLGRPTVDYDVIVTGDARELARALARRADAFAFALSEAFGAWRVLARGGGWRIDMTPLAAAGLEADLAQRDLTINAIARPLHGGAPIDPSGGLADLAARRLRMVGPQAFAADPLRVARLARLAAELSEFAIDPDTARAASASASALVDVSAERVFAELRSIVCGERPAAGLELLERLGATEIVLPELVALHGVQQSAYHHLDVHDHTIAVLERAAELARDPSAVFGELAGELAAVLDEPLADELTRGQALRFGALLHDIAKPATRTVVGEGQVRFFDHDVQGAEVAVALVRRLRGSERLAAHLAALTRHHLRLGFLVSRMPLGRRELYRYLVACDPVGVDVTLLSVADRLATLGRGSDAAVERHLEAARALMPAALQWRVAPPRPPLRGDELARALGIAPGPVLGRLLAELTEAAYAGEVGDAAHAVALARELHERPTG